MAKKVERKGDGSEDREKEVWREKVNRRRASLTSRNNEVERVKRASAQQVEQVKKVRRFFRNKISIVNV